MGRGSITPPSRRSAALRPAPLLGAVLVAAGLVAGCGGSAGSAGGGSTGTAVKAAAQAATSATIAQVRVVSQAKANRLPLGARETGVRDRLGKPEAVLAKQPFRCFVYATDAGPDTWLRMCFKDGRMTGLGTIAGRRTAMTLVVAKPQGDGRLLEPNVSRRHVRARTVSAKTS